MELIFQKKETLHAVYLISQLDKNISFNMHIYPQPQIYIDLGEKNN